MKAWLKAQWARFKAWILGGLAAIGITLGTLTVATAAVTFSWTLPTSNTDGTALDPAQIVETRIYCDIDPAVFTPQTQTAPASHAADLAVPGPGTVGQLDLPFGRHDCFATVLAQYTDAQENTAFVESGPSNIATKIVAPPQPAPPVFE